MAEVGKYEAANAASQAAYAEIWDAYNSDEGLWQLNNGELSVEATFDAIESLRLISLRATSGAPI